MAQLIRTDFVVLFIWHENTPSDSLRPTTPISTEAGGQGGGGGGGPGMGGGMGGASGGGSSPHGGHGSNVD